MMPIKREQIATDFTEKFEPTKNPSFEGTAELQERIELGTGDKKGVLNGYQKETEASGTDFHFGAVLPKDMTVSLIRADNASWEILISVLHSITLSFFMLFLGEFLATGEKEYLFTTLEKIALGFSGGLILILTFV